MLEVLVAISILGMGLTVLLSSQVGLFSSAKRAQNLSVATGLARCKMAEAELKLTQEGYPLIDQNDEGRCCEDEDTEGFSCRWKIETVKLPEPKGLSDPSGDGDLDDQSGLGTLGALQSIQTQGASALKGDGGIAGLSGLLEGAAAGGGVQGMAPLVMGLVYPSLKPMLEASIRKVSVSVVWKEGSKERDFSITQYVTNPQQGGLNPNAAQGLEEIGDALQP